jgi:hypothetical protein
LEQIILGHAFWESVVKVIKICEPIVDMLSMVDSNTPSMGFVYEAWIVVRKLLQNSLTMLKMSTWKYGR